MKRNFLKLKSKIVDKSEFKANWSIKKTMMNDVMMEEDKITNEEIKKLSHLSRINFDEKEIKIIQKDIQEIVNWFNIIKKVNTENIEPMYTTNEELNSLNNSRDDKEITEGNIQKETLSLTNLKKGNFYKVPKIIQED